MLSTSSLPLPVGQSGTDGVYGQVLGQLFGDFSATNKNTYIYMWVQNNSGTTLAAGDAVVGEYSSGVFAGTVTTTTTANNPNIAGIVPNAFGSNTIANGAYFALLVNGPGRPKYATTAITQTSVGSGALGTATTAGYVQPLTGTATGTAAATTADVAAYANGYLGVAVDTAGVTAAGQKGYAVIRCFDKF